MRVGEGGCLVCFLCGGESIGVFLIGVRFICLFVWYCME